MRGRSLGEGEIIATYFAPLAASHPGAFGLADDAASFAPPPGHDLVLTCDAVAEGVHSLPGDPPADVAWKALAVNVSDLVAKGATPAVYVMSVAFPTAPEPAWLAAFADGLAAAQAAFGIALVGGDTDRRPGPVAITITAIGLVPAGGMVRRGTARPSDRLLVTAPLGCSALGLALRRGDARALRWGLGAADRTALEDAYLRPQPQPAIAAVLRDHASAAMDISDGLVKDLTRMADASRVAAEIEAAQVPMSPAARRVSTVDPEAAMLAALTGGDDYCVLAAVPPDRVAAFVAAAAACGITVHDIGAVAAGAGVVVRDADGRPLALTRTGHTHFTGLY